MEGRQEVKRRILPVSMLTLAALLITVPLWASDVSGARWHGIIQVTNNSTSATGVAVNMTLNSASMVSNGYAAANLTDVAVLSSSTDTKFMPGSASDPWVLWVSSIGASLNDQYDLYSGNATDGTYAYFPGTAGMTTSDHATLEFGNNFHYYLKGWVDMSQAANITQKLGAFRLYNSAGTNITASLSTNFTDNLLYEGTTYIPVSADAGAYRRGGQLFTAFPATTISSVSLLLSRTGLGYAGITTANITARNAADAIIGTFGTIADVSTLATSPTWYTFNTASVTNPAVQDIRISLEFADGDATNYIVVWGYNADVVANAQATRYPNGGPWGNIAGQDTSYATLGVTANVAATSGEKEITLQSTGANLLLTVNSVTDNPGMVGATVPDNTSDIITGANGSLFYMTAQNITIGGTLQQSIGWQYNATAPYVFTDASGNGHNAVPTFRTTSSSAYVSATLLSLSPVTQAQVTDFSLTSLSDILSSTPGAITQMYTELDFSNVPGADSVNAMLAAGDIPQALWWYPFIFLGICIVGLLVYGATTLASSQGRVSVETQQEGSLLAMCIVMECGFVVWGVLNPIPLLAAILFPIPAIALIVSKKHYSWG